MCYNIQLTLTIGFLLLTTCRCAKGVSPTMQKIAAFIVKKRKLLLVVMLALAVVCAALMPFVGVNTDMTKYLPNSSQMKIGIPSASCSAGWMRAKSLPSASSLPRSRTCRASPTSRTAAIITAMMPRSTSSRRSMTTTPTRRRRSSATWPSALPAMMWPCAATIPRRRAFRRSCSSSRSCL